MGACSGASVHGAKLAFVDVMTDKVKRCMYVFAYHHLAQLASV